VSVEDVSLGASPSTTISGIALIAVPLVDGVTGFNELVFCSVLNCVPEALGCGFEDDDEEDEARILSRPSALLLSAGSSVIGIVGAPVLTFDNPDPATRLDVCRFDAIAAESFLSKSAFAFFRCSFAFSLFNTKEERMQVEY